MAAELNKLIKNVVEIARFQGRSLTPETWTVKKS